jgi:hypothetical protein
MTIPPIFQKLLRLLKVRGISGGLSITDTAVSFVWGDGDKWRVVTGRLPAGVVVKGRVVDAAQLKETLTTLHAGVFSGKKKDAPIQTIVSLGSAEAYLQSFNLPVLEGAKLDEAVALNLSMSSPMPEDKGYAGWQIVGKDKDSVRLEILSAFVEKDIIDSMAPILRDAGFIMEVVEPGVLSLARAVRMFASGFDSSVPVMLILLEDAGVRIVLLKDGAFSFQYLVLWTEIKVGGKEIAWETFQAALLENVKRVLGFAAAHGGAPAQAFLVGGNLQDSITELLANNLHLAVSPLIMYSGNASQVISAEWWNSLGAAVRTEGSLREDKEMSLLGVSARQEFVRQQALRFMSFWRVAFPVWLVVLLVIAFGVTVVVGRTKTSVENQARIATTSDQGKEIQALQARAIEFNGLVSALTSAAGGTARVPMVEKVRNLLADQGATFTRLSVDVGGHVSFEGQIASEEKVLDLANAFRANPQISEVNIPLQEISSDEGKVRFSMTFTIASSNTP